MFTHIDVLLASKWSLILFQYLKVLLPLPHLLVFFFMTGSVFYIPSFDLGRALLFFLSQFIALFIFGGLTTDSDLRNQTDSMIQLPRRPVDGVQDAFNKILLIVDLLTEWQPSKNCLVNNNSFLFWMRRGFLHANSTVGFAHKNLLNWKFWTVTDE